MRTTALVVEIIVVGVLGAAALLPIAAPLLGMALPDVWVTGANMPLVPQLALAYAAGVVWNRACNLFFGPLEWLVRRVENLEKTAVQRQRIRLSLTDSPLATYLDSTRGLVRVLRATSALIAAYLIFDLSGLPYLTLERETAQALWPFLLLALAFCLYAWHRLYSGYIRTIDNSAAVLSKQE